MRARLKMNSKQQRAAEKLLDDEHERIFRAVADDLLVQNLATVFWTLAVNDGWGKKRLRKFADDLHETKRLMNNPSALHHRFSPLECEKIINDKFGIDLRSEFRAQVEVKM